MQHFDNVTASNAWKTIICDVNKNQRSRNKKHWIQYEKDYFYIACGHDNSRHRTG